MYGIFKMQENGWKFVEECQSKIECNRKVKQYNRSGQGFRHFRFSQISHDDFQSTMEDPEFNWLPNKNRKSYSYNYFVDGTRQVIHAVDSQQNVITYVRRRNPEYA